MLQTKLPIFPEGITNITSDLAFKKENGRVTYFNFSMPVFVHGEEEYETFRMITSQFYVNGTATQAEISRAFGVTLVSVKRSVKIYKQYSPKGFYRPRNTREAVVLTDKVLKEIQTLLFEGKTSKEIANKLRVSTRSIEAYLENLKLKLNCYKKSELIDILLKNNLNKIAW